MDNAKELLVSMAAITCFCLGISFLVYVTHTMNKEMDFIKENIYVQHAIYPYQ